MLAMIMDVGASFTHRGGDTTGVEHRQGELTYLLGFGVGALDLLRKKI